MASCTFDFDIVVTHIDLTRVESVNSKELQVEATINYRTVSITASRINVTEFKDNCSTELNVVPANLRQTLEKCGMPVLVKYSGEILCTGQLSFPANVTESISENMQPLMHVDTCRLERDGQKIGTLEVLYRLFTKCTNQPKPGESSCRRDMDKSINKEDILFIFGGSQRCPADCDPCLDAVDPGEGDDYLRLGRQSVQTAAPKFVDTLIHNPVGDSVCCEIKNMADDCDQILNSIFSRSGHPRPLKPPCRKPADFNNPCIRLARESQESFRTTPCFSSLPVQQVESRDVRKMVQVPLPIDDMKSDKRFCHVCLTNMSFLPKFAACPNCGIKPMPITEQCPKENKLTVDQILMEYLCKPADVDDGNSTSNAAKEIQETECHCTCNLGKLCAHCRVVKKCSEFYHKTGSKVPKVSENIVESEEDCSISVEEKMSRQFLAQLFSELCDLQNITGIRRASELEREYHQKSLQKKKRHRGGHKMAHKNKGNSVLACVSSDAGFTLRKSEHLRRLISVGHKDCVSTVGRVSRHHGWNWSVSPEARKYGWRPGAIRKPILKLMKFFLHYSPADKAFNKCKKEEAELEKTHQLPILNLCKKNGEIFITLRTINNPHVRMDPIVFKVVKSDLAVALREIKRKLKEKGFPKCTCHKTVMMCVCRDNLAKKHLEYALSKECKRRGMENCVDHLVLTDTSDSEMEFDFDVSPPAALATSLKEHTTTNGTQTDKKDLNVPPKYPVPLNPYWRTYDCASGDRYTGTGFGDPGEAVFEDGIFGHGGGGPHGESAAPVGKTKAAGVWGVSPGGPMRGGGRTAPVGTGGGVAGGGGAVFGGNLHGKSFPGVKKPRSGPSPAIPVRMHKRHIEAVKQAAQAEKDAVKDEVERRKKGIDTMKYLMKKGTVPEPWDPNNPKPKGQPKPALAVGPDGLTDAQRKRQALNKMDRPPIGSMPRLGGGNRCCCAERCYPCCYYC
ncbi:GH23735 [Drosophila grimshawi]|uniref:GH23735 n=1 Tax=Drosophila grimshawi TaxID=7222 RepID=B4JTC7_DROGR|nr:GH23735 [Drosophila grimshawi]